MNKHEKINYLELPANNLATIKEFFIKAFNWSFTDYGDEYVAFTDGVIDGGFYQADLKSSASLGSVLIVLFSNNLEITQAKIESAGGLILKPTYSFPGGRRFHFADPCGNEYAVWSDK